MKILFRIINSFFIFQIFSGGKIILMSILNDKLVQGYINQYGEEYSFD